MISIEALIPELQQPARQLINIAERAGVNPRLTSTLRSHSEQARLYAQYVRGNRVYPAAPPGTSAHEYGYAFDLVLNSDADLFDLGSVWQSWGGIWGGQVDPIHFEYPGFSALRQAVGVGVSGEATSQCTKVQAAIAGAVDVALGFLPYVGVTELTAWLLSLGFPHSEVLQFLSSPVSTSFCR